MPVKFISYFIMFLLTNLNLHSEVIIYSCKHDKDIIRFSTIRRAPGPQLIYNSPHRQTIFKTNPEFKKRNNNYELVIKFVKNNYYTKFTAEFPIPKKQKKYQDEYVFAQVKLYFTNNTCLIIPRFHCRINKAISQRPSRT